MLICLLRHAEAETISATGLDEDRSLTRDGHKRMLGVSKGIAKLGLSFDEILISPLVRARETAEPVAEALRHSRPLIVTPSLSPSAGPEQVLGEVGKFKRGSSILLVGHMPHLGETFGRLLTGRGGIDVPMKKASLAAFEGEPFGPAELRFYLPARILESIA